MKEKEKTINKKKNNFFVKLKGYDKNEKNTSILKREFDYKSLKNFDIMMNNFINLILEIRKKGYGNRVPIIVNHHPEIGEIFIYSREQWDLYYKFNIIEDCINILAPPFLGNAFEFQNNISFSQIKSLKNIKKNN